MRAIGLLLLLFGVLTYLLPSYRSALWFTVPMEEGNAVPLGSAAVIVGLIVLFFSRARA